MAVALAAARSGRWARGGGGGGLGAGRTGGRAQVRRRGGGAGELADPVGLEHWAGALASLRRI